MAGALISLGFGFRELLLNHAPDAFNSPDEDMSYAWYVPLFSLYILWSERARLISSLGRPSVSGTAAIIPFLMIAFLGVRGIQVRFEMLAFIGLLVAIPWAFFGRALARRILPAAAFLLFCLPLTSFLDVITVHLRLLATSVAYAALKGFGVEVIRRGTMLAAENGSFAIDVAAPCSGLRSLFALVALTAAYAYLNQRTWFKRALLLAMSVPIAIIGNVVRILSISLVAATASSEFATGFYHDYSGYVVFIVAILLMVGAGELISRTGGGGRRDRTDAAAAAYVEPLRISGFGWAVTGAAFALVVSAMASLASSPRPELCPAPEKRLGELAAFTSESVAPSKAEIEVLPGDTRIDKRIYTAENGSWHLVSMVTGGRSKSSIHRPELCLPAQGFLMEGAKTADAGGVAWRMMRLRRGVEEPQYFAYTFFNQEGFRTASHTRRIFRDVWDRSFRNRIDRWVMVTVNSECGSDDEFEAFLAKIAEVVE